MNPRDLFTVGLKLIGVYLLAKGVTTVPTLLKLLELPDSLGEARTTLALLLMVVVQLFVGWYLVRSAPWVMKSAGYGSPDVK